MDLLRPVVRPYAWGSRRAIAELTGRAVPSAGPEAELWMGAHPSAPSGVDRDGRAATLDAVIAADPARELGAECAARFGGRLPFLLKVLAAEAALSIQLHPSRTQAEAGFRAENERGLLPGDPARNYVDDWPKPELLCALTPFEVLTGLRDPADAAGLLRALAVEALVPLARQLERGSSMADALRTVLEWPAGQRPALVRKVVAACQRLASANGPSADAPSAGGPSAGAPSAGGPSACAPSAGGPYAPACAAAARVAADHPGDLGVVALLLMRHAVLPPGQAMFMPAGGLHAYLRGTGVELLANSDNVVRAGLTGKHVDVPELLKLLDPAAVAPVLRPVPLGDGVSWYDTPAPEFRLYTADLAGPAVALPGSGPRIVLCTEGAVVLHSDPGHVVKLGRGESCFVSAADGPIRCGGEGRVFLAGSGADPAALGLAGAGTVR